MHVGRAVAAAAVAAVCIGYQVPLEEEEEKKKEKREMVVCTYIETKLYSNIFQKMVLGLSKREDSEPSCLSACLPAELFLFNLAPIQRSICGWRFASLTTSEVSPGRVQGTANGPSSTYIYRNFCVK